MSTTRKLIIFLSLTFFLQVGSAQDNSITLYSLTVSGKSLSELVSTIEKITGLSIAFSPSVTSPSTKISCKISTRNLSEFLDAVFKNNGIAWEIIDKQIVLRKLKESSPIRFKTIYGTVRDARSGELLAGAGISVAGTASVFTNSYGYFSVQLPVTITLLEVFYPGYQPTTLQLTEKLALPCIVALEPLWVEMQPVEIKEKRSSAGYWETGQGGLLMRQLREGSGGNDMITALGTLPGFSLFGDGSTRFFVRGGESSQNLILVDESPVFNPSHLFGFVSSLDASIIREIRAWKGDAPSEFGNRLSGVVDIHLKEGNLNKLAGIINLNPFFSSTIIEVPLKKEKAGLMVSARRSNLEWLRLSAFTPYDFNFSFYDLHLKLNSWLNNKNRLYATFYSSSDQYSAVTESVFKNYGLGWHNLLTSLRWNWLAGSQLFVNTLFNTSRYNYRLYLNSRHTDYWNSAVNWFALHSNVSWFLSPRLVVRAGGGVENYISEPGNVVMGPGGSAVFSSNSRKFRSLSGFAYVGSEITTAEGKWFIHPGLRITVWGNYGPQVVPYFNSEYQVFATDTIPSGQFYYTHTSLEPRLRLVFRTSETIRLMASVASIRQYFQPLSNTASPFSTLETWMPSGPNIKPQSSLLLSAGIGYTSPAETFECSIEAYFRDLKGQIDYRDHAGLLYEPFPEGQIRQGNARAAGIEFRLSKAQGKFTGGLTYVFSRVKRTTSGINDGNTYFPYFDRPHQAMFFLKYNNSRSLNVGTAWYLSNGGMTTLPSGFYLENGLPVPVYSKRYNARLPLYHRLDLFANYSWKGQKTNLTYEISLNIRNAYGRHNPFIFGFNKVMDDEGHFRVPADLNAMMDAVPTRLSVSGVLPSLSFKISF